MYSNYQDSLNILLSENNNSKEIIVYFAKKKIIKTTDICKGFEEERGQNFRGCVCPAFPWAVSPYDRVGRSARYRECHPRGQGVLISPRPGQPAIKSNKSNRKCS